MFTADRRLYLTADRQRLVEEGDPLGATLYVAAGDEMSDEDAIRFGLVADAPAPAPEPEPAPEPAPRRARS